MPTRIAILDDYNKIGLSIGDWKSLKDCEIMVFEGHLYDVDALIERLKPFDVVCAMREHTAFPRKVFESLPNLKTLNVTAGLHSRVFDFNAAQDYGVVCWRTDPDLPYPDGSKRPGTTMEITFASLSPARGGSSTPTARCARAAGNRRSATGWPTLRSAW